LPHSPNDRFNLSLGLLWGDVRREPADDTVAARPALLHFVIRKSKRLPDIGAFAELRTGDIEERKGKLKACRHDTDDGENPTVSGQFAPKDARVSIELAPPEAFADDNDIVATLRAFFRAESATAHRLNA
jgi:hypothetical protein